MGSPFFIFQNLLPTLESGNFDKINETIERNETYF